MDRRSFLRGTIGTVAAAWPAEALAQQAARPSGGSWDPGRVRHLLPVVSDTRLLLKASFTQPLQGAPALRVSPSAGASRASGATVQGRMNDTVGECWQFYAAGLQPATRYNLALVGPGGAALCEPWE